MIEILALIMRLGFIALALLTLVTALRFLG